MNTLGENIKKYRKENELTQEDVATYVGKTKNVVSHWEKGVNRPDADTIFLLCQLLKITPNQLFGWSDNIQHNEENKKITVGENIKKIRENLNMTQTDLAKQVNISKQTLYKYETNVITNIPFNVIEKIANILSVSPVALMGWENEITTSNTVQKLPNQIQILVNKAENLNLAGINELIKYLDYLLSQKEYQKGNEKDMAI